jgi:hypothetical protein
VGDPVLPGSKEDKRARRRVQLLVAGAKPGKPGHDDVQLLVLALVLFDYEVALFSPQ